MRLSGLFRLVMIVTLVGFMARVDVACKSPATMPIAAHAGDCADLGGTDHAPKQNRDDGAAPPCAYACVTFVAVQGESNLVWRPGLSSLEPSRLLALIGSVDRPPTPPPRVGQPQTNLI